MEFFALIKMHFAMCGIEISQKSSKSHHLNSKNLTLFCLICLNVTLYTVPLKDANSFDECTDILYRSISLGLCGIFYLIIVIKTSKSLQFLSNLADTYKAS